MNVEHGARAERARLLAIGRPAPSFAELAVGVVQIGGRELAEWDIPDPRLRRGDAAGVALERCWRVLATIPQRCQPAKEILLDAMARGIADPTPLDFGRHPGGVGLGVGGPGEALVSQLRIPSWTALPPDSAIRDPTAMDPPMYARHEGVLSFCGLPFRELLSLGPSPFACNRRPGSSRSSRMHRCAEVRTNQHSRHISSLLHRAAVRSRHSPP